MVICHEDLFIVLGTYTLASHISLLLKNGDTNNNPYLFRVSGKQFRDAVSKVLSIFVSCTQHAPPGAHLIAVLAPAVSS